MAAQIRDVVEQYVKLVATGPTEDIIALYAPDAVVEDPIGSPPRHGHEAIREMYKALEAAQRETRVDTVRVVGSHAIVGFTLVTRFGEHKMTLSPIDVMEFDEQGLITSMKAYWCPDDMVNETA